MGNAASDEDDVVSTTGPRIRAAASVVPSTSPIDGNTRRSTRVSSRGVITPSPLVVTSNAASDEDVDVKTENEKSESGNGVHRRPKSHRRKKKSCRRKKKSCRKKKENL